MYDTIVSIVLKIVYDEQFSICTGRLGSYALDVR